MHRQEETVLACCVSWGLGGGEQAWDLGLMGHSGGFLLKHLSS